MEKDELIKKSMEVHELVKTKLLPFSAKIFLETCFDSFPSYYEISKISFTEQREKYPIYHLAPFDFNICFALAYAKGKKDPTQIEMEEIMELIMQWAFLTNLIKSGEYFYIKSMSIDDQGVTQIEPDRQKWASAREIALPYVKKIYEATQGEDMTFDKLIELEIENLKNYQNDIFNETGISTSFIFYILKSIAAKQIKKSSNIDDKFIKINESELRKECILIAKQQKGFNSKEFKMFFDTNLNIIKLNQERAEKFILNRLQGTPFTEDIWTYPCWDFPLVKYKGNILSNINILIDCVPEIKNRLLKLSRLAYDKYKKSKHDELIYQTKQILENKGFKTLEIKKIIYDNKKEPIAEFDLIMEKNNIYFNIECKTITTPLRQRMYLNLKELEKEAHDFLKENRLTGDKWNKKQEIFKTNFSKNKEIKNIVITNIPQPAMLFTNNPEIIWIKDLEEAIK